MGGAAGYQAGASGAAGRFLVNEEGSALASQGGGDQHSQATNSKKIVSSQLQLFMDGHRTGTTLLQSTRTSGIG